MAVPVHVIPLPPADLVTSGVVVPRQAFDGSEIEVRYTVSNLGGGETNADSWTDTIWLTRDKNRPHPCAGDMLIGNFVHYGALAIDDFAPGTVAGPLTLAAGSHDVAITAAGEAAADFGAE